MQITVKYFGSLVEKTGIKEEQIDVGKIGSGLEALKAYCFQKYGISNGGSIQTAVNQTLQNEGDLEHGDEVVFLPPYSGG